MNAVMPMCTMIPGKITMIDMMMMTTPGKHWVRDYKLTTWVFKVATEFDLPRYAKNSPKLSDA